MKAGLETSVRKDAPDGLAFSPLAAVVRDLRQRVTSGDLGVLPVVLGLALIWTFFELQDTHFLTARNLSNLVLQISVSGTIAIGVVLVLLLGEIDLSVGSVAGATAAVLGVLLVNDDWPWWAAIAATLVVGALAGLLGWLGVQLHVLGDAGTLNVFDAHITDIASTFLPPLWSWVLAAVLVVGLAGSRLVEQSQRQRAGMVTRSRPVLLFEVAIIAVVLTGAAAVLNYAYGVPTVGVLLMGLVIFFDWLTRRTKFGRHVYAVGGNAEATRRAGIGVARIRVVVFALSGTLAAIGGLFSTARLQASSTQTGGGTLLLEAIAAAVIGGTSLFGGRGSVWSALLGALVIGSVSNGLDLVGQPADVKYMVEGAILLLAVTIDAYSRRRLTLVGR